MERKLLNEDEMLEHLANLGLKRSKPWARHARMDGSGPEFVRVRGRFIRYSARKIESWLEDQLEYEGSK